MNFLLRAPIEPKLLSENSTPLLVVIAYDDVIAGQTAMRTYRRLFTQFEDELKVRHSSWTFRELGDPHFAEEAIISASAANLVIVATVNGKVLPWQVKAWIEKSLFQREEKDSALAVLVATTKSEMLSNVAVHEYLQEVAEEANVQFFPSVFELPRTNAAGVLASLWERSEASSSVLEEILRRPPPPPRWGINE
jgi:hypothetical protein